MSGHLNKNNGRKNNERVNLFFINKSQPPDSVHCPERFLIFFYEKQNENSAGRRFQALNPCNFGAPLRQP